MSSTEVFVPGARTHGPDASLATRRARRRGSVAILVGAFFSLMSALAPHLSRRIRPVQGHLPLVVHQTGAVISVLAGLLLLQVARGIKRGQRLAWTVAVVILSISVVNHLLKGPDLVEASVAALALIYLWTHRRYFRTTGDPESIRAGLLTVLIGVVLAVAMATVALHFRRQPQPLGTSFRAVTQRLVGIRKTPIRGRPGHILDAALPAVSIGLVLSAGWQLVRPRVLAKVGANKAVSFEDARTLVQLHGDDTLAYFALRADKQHHIVADTLIAYAVHNGICLVSPDPIGPPEQRDHAWHAFRSFVAEQGWGLGVLGAAERWLPIYESSDMTSIYIGDEAIVDCQTFSLQGGEMKSLRQAAARIAKHGYTISFHDPSTIDPALATALRALMAESRQGDVERGFSMTLSRVFDPRDTGLLMAVCHGPNGAPAAFCQFVPAADIVGYSLDLMRRSTAEHPNGLTDFVIVQTIAHLREHGFRGVSLNFATMRAIVAGEKGDAMVTKVQRWFLDKMSESMQIESLWKYNAKFKPTWRPRYAVYDAHENVPAILLAMAKAESWWEIPVIGGLFKPDDDAKP